MRILVTAGPTREYIDPVRFITNASSGRMGYAVAAAAARRGHRVTLLSGPVAIEAPRGCRVVPFVSVDDLVSAMREHFPRADAVVMSAAVGDFRPARASRRKLRRGGGPITLRLVPTPDVLAAAARRRRPGQVVFAFAVEKGPRRRIESQALREMARKNADYVLLNTPAAMGGKSSAACILCRRGVLLPWRPRTKAALAGTIVRVLELAARPGFSTGAESPASPITIGITRRQGCRGAPLPPCWSAHARGTRRPPFAAYRLRFTDY